MNKPAIHWYKVPEDEVLKLTESSPDGLSDAEVQERKTKYGENKIPEPKGKTLLGIFIHQFLSPLIYVLIGAAIISLVVGEYKDAFFILAIIVLNAILGTWQESKAENSAAALRDLVKVKARIKRNKRILLLDAEEIVPGDVIMLESGMKVPCDLRLMEAKDLSVEEALLTGESLAVQKKVEKISGENLTAGDQLNMAFAATTIQKGRAWGIAVNTGLFTEIGKIAASLSTTSGQKPPLVKRMEVFSKKISIVVLVACLLLFFYGLYIGMDRMEVFLLMVAVGVSAIPEGLPVALTVALSIGTNRMARRNVIVRKLPAVEGLGSCTLIASDKTGTLTLDEQSAKSIHLPNGEIFTVTGQGYNGDGELLNEQQEKIDSTHPELFRFLQASILSNEGILRKTDIGWENSGDAIDVALRALAYKAGQKPVFFTQETEVVKVIPYESELKFSGIFYKKSGELYFALKGASEVVGNYLNKNDKEFVSLESENMAKTGLRVLAIAGGKVNTQDLTQLHNLNLYGLVGLIDPLRPEAIEAIELCHKAGVDVVMITGDHPATAFAIAKELGIAVKEEEVISGQQLHVLTDGPNDSYNDTIKGMKVFARVSPMQKKELVNAFKELGHFVAVTGDGANDAPALKSAHMGIAMGGGTDLAKEASSLIVTDNNFASITAGIEEGRFTYDNLRKIIYMLISTGAAEIILIALPLIFGLPLPFIAVQLLWLNLVTNGIQDISLAFEKGDPDVMKKAPRKPNENIFDPLMIREIVFSAAVMASLTFGLWYILLEVNGYDEFHARTIIMMLMVLLQNFHVLNCRSETKSLFSLPIKNNYFVLGAIVVAQLVHISASYIPGLSDVLQLDPITFAEWVKLIPTAIVILLAMEVFKYFERKRAGKSVHL